MASGKSRRAQTVTANITEGGLIRARFELFEVSFTSLSYLETVRSVHELGDDWISEGLTQADSYIESLGSEGIPNDFWLRDS